MGTSWGGRGLENGISRCSPGGRGLVTYAPRPWNRPRLLRKENKAAHLSLRRVSTSLKLVGPRGPGRRPRSVCLVRPAASPRLPVPPPLRPPSEAVNHPHALSAGEEVWGPPGLGRKRAPHTNTAAPPIAHKEPLWPGRAWGEVGSGVNVNQLWPVVASEVRWGQTITV